MLSIERIISPNYLDHSTVCVCVFEAFEGCEACEACEACEQTAKQAEIYGASISVVQRRASKSKRIAHASNGDFELRFGATIESSNSNPRIRIREFEFPIPKVAPTQIAIIWRNYCNSLGSARLAFIQ